jgi:hypothetical protein
MTKTRTLQLLSLAASTIAGAFVGCASNETSMNAVLAPEPGDNLVFADTTQPTRDYSQSVAIIQNGDTVADGSTGFRYRSADNVPTALVPAAEVGVFAANVGTLPYTLISERNKEHVSTGLQFPPTYTAMPALPDAPVAPEAPPTPPVETDTAISAEMAPADAALSAAATMPAVVEHAENRPDQILLPAGGDNSPAFTVAGQVLRPGTYAAKDLRLSQIIVAAGPSSEDPTKVGVQIDRSGEETAKTTLDQILSGAVEDVMVKSGDVITIGVLP